MNATKSLLLLSIVLAGGLLVENWTRRLRSRSLGKLDIETVWWLPYTVRQKSSRMLSNDQGRRS